MQPGYVMAGWERDRQEPVLMPIPVPDTREAPPSLRARQLLCRPGRFDSWDETAPRAAAHQEY